MAGTEEVPAPGTSSAKACANTARVPVGLLEGIVKKAHLVAPSGALSCDISISEAVPVSSLVGCGPKTLAALSAAGVTAVQQLAELPAEEVPAAARRAHRSAVAFVRLVQRTAARGDTDTPATPEGGKQVLGKQEEEEDVIATEQEEEEDVVSTDKGEDEDVSKEEEVLELTRQLSRLRVDPVTSVSTLSEMDAFIVPRTTTDYVSRRVCGTSGRKRPRTEGSAVLPLKSRSGKAPRGRGTKAFAHLLATYGLEEVETLNGVAPAGSCQFASVGEQLFRRLCTPTFRYDQLLRRAACAEIKRRASDFQPYLLAARVRTRRQERAGGDGIDMNTYLQRMMCESCDGDHVTLQALSDITGAVIHVVKWDIATRSACILPPVSPAPAAICHAAGQGQLPSAHGRHLWLSLRGESHFRSLHASASHHAASTPSSAQPTAVAAPAASTLAAAPRPSPSPPGASP